MTIYLPPPGRLIQGWRLSRQNLNFVDVKIWFPPTFGSQILVRFYTPPSLSCVSRGLQACKHQPTKLVGIDLQACRLRLTGVYVLAHIERDSCRQMP
jgi:hypothetical protein